MRKLKLLLAGLLICSGLFASEKEDIKFLQGLFSQKKYNLALDESNRFIKTYPNSKYVKNIMQRMGKIYIAEGRYNDAVNILNECLKTQKLKTKELNQIYLDLAKAYAGMRDYATANKAAKLIKNENSVYEEALLEIGKAQIKNGDYLNAQNQLRSALAIQGENYDEVVLNLALAAYNNSQYIKTIVYLDEFYRSSGNSQNSQLVDYLYGSSYYKTNDNVKALQYFEKVINSSQDSDYKTFATLTAIEIYLKQGQFTKAETILNKLQPGTDIRDKTLKNFGDYYLVKGIGDKALEYYDQISNKNTPEVIYGIGLSQYRLGDYVSSLSNFRRLYPTKYRKESIYYQFSIEYKNKNYNWIVENIGLSKGLDFSKDESLAINSIIAGAAFDKKDYKTAYEYYLKNYNMSPSKENLYRLLVTASKNNDSKEVYELAKEYSENYPTDQEYKKNITIILADQYIQDSNPQKAVEIYESYLSRDKDSDILTNLIDIKIAQKEYKSVMDYLNMQDMSPENTYLKGIATMGMGKYDEAEIYFTQLTENNTDKNIPMDLQEKSKYNIIKNYFLWERYQEVVDNGEKYIQGDNLFGLEDVVDKVAISYFRMDNPEKAREYFEKLKLVSNMGDYAQFQIGETYYSEKNYQKAIEAYGISATTARSKEYREKGLYWELSSLYLLKNVQDFNLKSEEYLKLYPKSDLKDNILLMKGELYSEAGNSKDSLANYEKLYKETQDVVLKEKSLMKIIDIAQLNNDATKELEWINKITNDEKKTYYTARYLQKQKRIEEAKVEYDKLMLGKDYKDFAASGLGDYYFDKGDMVNARSNYETILNMENSIYKDKALFQVANIDKQSGNLKDAIRNYTKLYVLYPGSEYALESQIRIAESYENNKEYKEAISQYEELLKFESKNKDYFLEKLIFLNLKIENSESAKKYYNQLKTENLKLSEKYKDFFNGGEKI